MIMEEELYIKKEILVKILLKNVLLISLRVKLQALEYKHQWLSPFPDKEIVV